MHAFDFKAMARELTEQGFDPAQSDRFDFAFHAAQIAAFALLRAQRGMDTSELLETLQMPGKLPRELERLVSRMEVSPAFIGYIHSGLRF